MSKEKESELIIIETKDVIFTLKGKPVHPTVDILQDRSLKGERIVSKIEVKCNTEFTVSVFNDDNKVYNQSEIYSKPLFYENQDYLLTAESFNLEKDISFFHQNKSLRDSISTIHRKDIINGIVNFRNDIGYSELIIKLDGDPHLKLTIEVFPAKIDYQEDYQNLMKEVSEEIHNLAFDFLKRTYQKLSIRNTADASLVEFYSILEAIFNDFLKAFDRISKAPHHKLFINRSIINSAKAKNIDNRSIKWIRKNPRHYDRNLQLPLKVLDTNKRISFDTYENQFVKFIFIQIRKKLYKFRKRYLIQKYSDEMFITKLEMMIKRINKTLKTSYLKDVSKLNKINSISLVLQMAIGYKSIYKYYLLLVKGLNLTDDIYKLSIKDLALLYEYWCFLKINSILSEKYKLIKTDIIKLDKSGIYFSLKQGRETKVTYCSKKTDEKFDLCYNIIEGDSITTGQKPDTVLTLEKEHSKVKYQFIFDAKYRINPGNTDSIDPGPEESDINTMHRYRDSIVSNNDSKYERTIFGAYVLFPYHNENHFRKHKFYKSIEKVNVGAFPFLPNHTELLTEFIEHIINESHISSFERSPLAKGTYDYYDLLTFKKNLLVTNVRSKENFDYWIQNNCIYIKESQLNMQKYILQYVALYQSISEFNDSAGIYWYGEVEDISVISGKAVSAVNGLLDSELYYEIKVSKWNKLSKKINVSKLGISTNLITNDLALKTAREVKDLHINTAEEWKKLIEYRRKR